MRQCIGRYREKKIDTRQQAPAHPFAGGFLSTLSLFHLSQYQDHSPESLYFLFLLIYCMLEVLFPMVMLRGPSSLPHG
jgi:hypothetical protein